MKPKVFLFYLMLMLTVGVQAAERQKLNFNADWRLAVGDYVDAEKPEFDVEIEFLSSAAVASK